MYFIGVSTSESAAHLLFPQWVDAAGQPFTDLIGYDLPLDAPRDQYRRAMQTMLDDSACLGALVTSHKVALVREAAELFTDFDDDALALKEVSCIVRRPGRMSGLALDTVTAGLAAEDAIAKARVPVRAMLILGAGGAGVALAKYFGRRHLDIPVTLTEVALFRSSYVNSLGLKCTSTSEPESIIEGMPEGSLIVNATGMGKDRAGSPVRSHVRFPANAIAWDFNYRGNLRFLELARAQGAITIDGWDYFIHGWTQIMSRVLGFDLTPDRFAKMSAAANAARP